MMLGDKTHDTMKQMTEDYLMTNAPTGRDADVLYHVIKREKNTQNIIVPQNEIYNLFQDRKSVV